MKYMVILFDVELSMIMSARTVSSMNQVEKEFSKYATEYIDTWKDMDVLDQNCYFDCKGYQECGYMVQWFKLDSNGSFENNVKL